MYKYLVAVHVMFFIVASATMLHWNYTTQINGTNQLLPRTRHRQKGSLCGKQSDARVQISSWMSTPGGRVSAPNALSSYKGCLHMPRQQGRRKSNGLFTMATGNQTLGWMLRWRSLPFSWLGLKPLETKSGNSITITLHSPLSYRIAITIGR